MEHDVHITIQHIEPDIAHQLRDYAQRRLAFALRRFQRQIRDVRVRLSDVNGPRRGIDARCSVMAELINGRQVFVHATTAWPFASVTTAAARLNEALRRVSSCNRPFHCERSMRRRRRLTRGVADGRSLATPLA
ncbi:MAG TPA: HPF/RaiA family ribosome-associated protein [Vicinamibacterales bacterium]|nr:HPF/RaiA family ribosome-associated protein [Vicinamibacterales bacterium]